jgi:biopolymer transport protein ExbD
MPEALKDDEDEISGINVTPLVDIMLVLIVIFMATAHFIYHRMVKIDLPKMTHSQVKPMDSLQLTLSATGTMTLNNKPLDPGELVPTLKSSLRVNPGLRVTISADKSVVWDKLAGILDACKEAGVVHVGAVVEPRAKPLG